jgi:hypothetical protein
MLIMSFDPGGTTGWCSAELDDGGDTVDLKHIDFGHLDKEDHHNQLRKLLGSKKPDLVICERFEKRTNDFALLISCEYIGVIKMWSQQYKRPVVFQGASQAKVFMTVEKLIKLDAYITPAVKNKHAQDARKHLMYYLTTNKSRRREFVMLRNNLLRKLR